MAIKVYIPDEVEYVGDDCYACDVCGENALHETRALDITLCPACVMKMSEVPALTVMLGTLLLELCERRHNSPLTWDQDFVERCRPALKLLTAAIQEAERGKDDFEADQKRW